MPKTIIGMDKFFDSGVFVHSVVPIGYDNETLISLFITHTISLHSWQETIWTIYILLHTFEQFIPFAKGSAYRNESVEWIPTIDKHIDYDYIFNTITWKKG